MVCLTSETISVITGKSVYCLLVLLRLFLRDDRFIDDLLTKAALRNPGTLCCFTLINLRKDTLNGFFGILIDDFGPFFDTAF